MRGVSGAENHLLELVAALRGHGWVSDVLIPSPAPEQIARLERRLKTVSERVHVVPMPRDASLALVWRLACLLASGRYDVAHAHLVHADWHLAAASVLTRRVPLVSSKHNPDPFRRMPAFRLVERAVVHRYSAVIAISDALRRFTEELTGASVVTIRYGLPARKAPPAKPDHRGAPRLLAVGRLERQKGFDVAVRALALLTQEVPGIRLAIAGEGSERARLAELVRNLGLEDAVALLGERDDVSELLREADVLVHPARWEGFGLVLLEAMRSALPIVATHAAAIPEIVEDGVTGALVPPDDPDALAAALLAFIRNPSTARQRGIAGYNRLRQQFSPEAMARGVADVYESVLRPAAPARAVSTYSDPTN